MPIHGIILQKRFRAILLCFFFVVAWYLYKYQTYNYIIEKLSYFSPNHSQDRKANQAVFEELELYLRMSSRFLDIYDNVLLPSLRYFWPGNVSIVVVLDQESAQDQELSKTLSKRYPYPRVEFQNPIDPSIYHWRGHERMQRDFFYPEDKIKKKYVGFIDTDTVFVTRVIPELLFEEGKPVIIGNYGKYDTPLFAKEESLGTGKMLKSKEIARGMAYFPVIMKLSHIVELRKYVEKLHNRPFDEIFKISSNGPFSQFSVMCQYAWNFHRDEYKFYFHLRSYNNGTWHGEDNPPGREPYQFYQTNVTEEQRMPKPRSSIHLRYHDNWKNPDTLRNVIKTGICFSGGFDLCPNQCKHLNRSGLQRELYYFEYNDWSWDKRCLDEQRKHYALVAEQSNDVALQALKAGCDEVGRLSFKP
ncbi:hypothetical protein CHS0354_019823 [Potamilus streckersoni]|uniref:Uncharacterized protein n=1 Tax=Potamilus streckersoni TaxID=2493646 RepID=A0AAE0TES9_9BIVA|nr:hypothetical protein CHS0354_019823 [Potamilus streckersoni]